MGRGRDIVGLVVAVAGTQAVGGLSALASGGDFERFFRELDKPAGTPPPAVFGPAWTGLYLLMGIAAWLVWREGITRKTAIALGLFAAQLALNFAWSLILAGSASESRSSRSPFCGSPSWRPSSPSGACARLRARSCCRISPG